MTIEEPYNPYDHCNLAVWREYITQFEHEDPPPKNTPNPASSWKTLVPTAKQAGYLRKKGVLVPATRGEASKLISKLVNESKERDVWSHAKYGYAYPDGPPRDYGDL